MKGETMETLVIAETKRKAHSIHLSRVTDGHFVVTCQDRHMRENFHGSRNTVDDAAELMQTLIDGAHGIDGRTYRVRPNFYGVRSPV